MKLALPSPGSTWIFDRYGSLPYKWKINKVANAIINLSGMMGSCNDPQNNIYSYMLNGSFKRV